MVYFAVYWGLMLVSLLRAAIFNEGGGLLVLASFGIKLFAPGVGGFAAVRIANKCFEHANLKVVTGVYLIPIVFFFFLLRIYLIVDLPPGYTFQWGEQLLAFAVALASVIGSLVALLASLAEKEASSPQLERG